MTKTSPPAGPRSWALRFSVIVIMTLPVFSSARASSSGENRRSLLLYVVNCLNRNHLSLYGYSRRTTPNLDRLARGSYVFKNLVSPATFTPPVMDELFGSRPAGRDFLLGYGWSDWRIPTLPEYPIGRFLADQGYDYYFNRVPVDPDRPFVAVFHAGQLHAPYDLHRLYARRLRAPSRRLYRELLKGSDEIRLVEKPGTPDQMDVVSLSMIFSVIRTEIPIADNGKWEEILAGLKETGDTPAAMVASALPARLSRRLAAVRSAGELTLEDKSDIVRALNRLIRKKDSVIGKILLGPGTYFKDDKLVMEGVSRPFSESKAGLTIVEQFQRWTDSVLVRRSDGRLGLASGLNQSRERLRRHIYRETLEFILPPLASGQAPGYYFFPDDKVLAAWKASPSYDRELGLYKDLYDAGLADVDRAFGGYVEHLRRLGVLDRTVVVFMGDHGEAFMEHDRLEHSTARCYDEVVNPPLVIYPPGRLSKTVYVDAQLRTADVFPTLLDLMGLLPPPGLLTEGGGRSAAPVLDGARMDITAYSRDLHNSRSLRRNGGWKLVWDLGTNSRKLFDTKRDPRETLDLSRDFPGVRGEMEEEMTRFLYGD